MLDAILDLDIDALEQHAAGVTKLLRGGLLGLAIWSTDTGLSLVGFDTPDEAIALFNMLTAEIDGTLSGSGFPGLNRYYMLSLKDNRNVLILRHGDDLMEAWTLDATKTNLGILFSVAVPKAMQEVAVARG